MTDRSKIAGRRAGIGAGGIVLLGAVIAGSYFVSIERSRPSNCRPFLAQLLCRLPAGVSVKGERLQLDPDERRDKNVADSSSSERWL